eukprot:1159451-Pelagomonas_calceolata.AAC.3
MRDSVEMGRAGYCVVANLKKMRDGVNLGMAVPWAKISTGGVGSYDVPVVILGLPGPLLRGVPICG